MPIDKHEQKKHECETNAYKEFMRVAKRVRALEYGKWTISPDMSDPLRKFTLDRDIGWCTIKIVLVMQDTYHRGVYDDNRWDFRGTIGIIGMHRSTQHDKFANKTTGQDLCVRTGIRVRPRLAKKLITYINESVIPRFYTDIENERAGRDTMYKDLLKHQAEIAKVHGLKQGQRKETWREPVAELSGCPLELTLQKEFVEISGRLTYDQLGRMATQMGWGK